MRYISFIFIICFTVSSCSNSPEPNVQLTDFSDDVSVQKLGQRLIDLPKGLNTLELGSLDSEELLIAVHGSRSEGYEWVYPLKTINTKKKEVYFYRWPDHLLLLKPLFVPYLLPGYSYSFKTDRIRAITHVLK